MHLAMSAPTLCIHCGLSAGEPPRLNRLEDGRPCPVCAERLLALLPPLLPAPARVGEEAPEDDFEAPEPGYDAADFDQPA